MRRIALLLAVGLAACAEPESVAPEPDAGAEDASFVPAADAESVPIPLDAALEPADAGSAEPADAEILEPIDAAIAQAHDASAPGADAALPAERDAGADADAGAGTVWQPAPRTSWQWQLSGTLDTSIDVAMYDVDLFETPEATIEALHAAGRIVVCYFSAGSYEEWRPDVADFPPEAIGKAMDGWAGESWLDVRHTGLRSVMQARLDLAQAKGCDGVEPDNVDGYQNDTGFPLAASDQLAYNRFLAAEAHTRGLSIGLKNDIDQIDSLVANFDWALNEECLKYDECGAYAPFTAAGKAVFHVEYGGAALANSVCPQTAPLQFSTLIKKLALDAWRVACP